MFLILELNLILHDLLVHGSNFNSWLELEDTLKQRQKVGYNYRKENLTCITLNDSTDSKCACSVMDIGHCTFTFKHNIFPNKCINK